MISHACLPTSLFQSALPVWGATMWSATPSPCQSFQSALPVWGATGVRRTRECVQKFQSALPVWGATGAVTPGQRRWEISIRAPRVGSDLSRAPGASTERYFNPRSPCGERLRNRCTFPRLRVFNPRSPCGERRGRSGVGFGLPEFQSALPVWGATNGVVEIVAWSEFQSALPVWGATNTFANSAALR